MTVRHRLFSRQAAVEHQPQISVTLRAVLHTIPDLGIIRAAEPHRALEEFVQTQARAVAGHRSALHADRDVPDFGLLNRDRLQHAEEGH